MTPRQDYRKGPRYCIACEGLTTDYEYVTQEFTHVCTRHDVTKMLAPTALPLDSPLVPAEFRKEKD